MISCFITDVGGLMGNLGKFPFMYRGVISDLDLAGETGFYNMAGTVSNAPFSQSWAPLVVIGNSYRLQIAALNVSDAFRLYVRLLGSNHGWKQITFQ